MDLALRFIWLWIGLLIFCILGFRIQWNFWILIKLFPICMGNFFAGAEHKRRPDARIFATYLCCAPFRIFFYNCQIFSILIYFSILDFSISLLKCTNDWNVVRWPLLAELRRVVGFFLTLMAPYYGCRSRTATALPLRRRWSAGTATQNAPSPSRPPAASAPLARLHVGHGQCLSQFSTFNFSFSNLTCKF